MKNCIDNRNPVLAEMVIHGLTQELDDEAGEVLFTKLLEDASAENLELVLEILKKNKSAKKILKSVYHLIVTAR